MLLYGWILAIYNYAPDAVQQSAETLFGEQIMISLFPALCVNCIFLGMMFYPLSDKKVKEISEQLDEKRKKKRSKNSFS